MAKAKVKGNQDQVRIRLMEELAHFRMGTCGLAVVGVTKEGLLFREKEADYVVKVIRKKEKVDNKDIVRVIEKSVNQEVEEEETEEDEEEEED